MLPARLKPIYSDNAHSRSLAPFSGPEPLVHTRSLADFITTTSGFGFSVHTARGFRNETAGSQGCVGVFEARDEALRSAGFDRHGQASVIPRSDECDR